MNIIIGIGEEVDESMVIQKVLISLHMRFDPKISTLEERKNIDSLSMDELHGIFTTYEIRIEQENPITKEALFKEFNKIKKKNKQNSKPYCRYNDDLEEDEEVTNFVRKLKIGTNKYKGMLPLIFLILMVLVIFLINFLMLIIKVVMKKKILRRKIKIKKDTREGTKINSSRNVSTQRKINPLQKRMMIVTVIQKEYFSWK
jgi:hypothetical protein